MTELVLTQPDPHMAKRLRRRVEEERPAAGVEVAEVGAESLPFIEASFDTVVSTLVFCTVDYPQAAVAGAHRVLSRAGRCCSSSTSVARGQRRARWQDRLERPWGWISGGCHPNRDTGGLLAAAFSDVNVNSGEFPGSGTALVKPLISGTAVR